MCETELPISDIIAAVGYENGSYFHRVFREKYHVTPRAFREINNKRKDTDMAEHTLLRKLESLWGIPIFMQMKQGGISGVLGFFPKNRIR